MGPQTSLYVGITTPATWTSIWNHANLEEAWLATWREEITWHCLPVTNCPATNSPLIAILSYHNDNSYFYFCLNLITWNLDKCKQYPAPITLLFRQPCQSGNHLLVDPMHKEIVEAFCSFLCIGESAIQSPHKPSQLSIHCWSRQSSCWLVIS